MARYIDADKFKSNLERAMEKMHLIGGVKGVDVGAVIVALDRQPTADVVPRAELAREIFEEIESHLATNQAGLSIIRFSTLANLKKKYTEDM